MPFVSIFQADFKQIYSLIFAAYPFQSLGDENVLVAQMVNFVERLPVEWEARWRNMLKKTGRNFFRKTCTPTQPVCVHAN